MKKPELARKSEQEHRTTGPALFYDIFTNLAGNIASDTIWYLLNLLIAAFYIIFQSISSTSTLDYYLKDVAVFSHQVPKYSSLNVIVARVITQKHPLYPLPGISPTPPGAYHDLYATTTAKPWITVRAVRFAGPPGTPKLILNVLAEYHRHNEPSVPIELITNEFTDGFKALSVPSLNCILRLDWTIVENPTDSVLAQKIYLDDPKPENLPLLILRIQAAVLDNSQRKSCLLQ